MRDIQKTLSFLLRGHPNPFNSLDPERLKYRSEGVAHGYCCAVGSPFFGDNIRQR
jgi:hypothetical protein